MIRVRIVFRSPLILAATLAEHILAEFFLFLILFGFVSRRFGICGCCLRRSLVKLLLKGFL